MQNRFNGRNLPLTVPEGAITIFIVMNHLDCRVYSQFGFCINPSHIYSK